jgi:hypothetical protein
MCVHTRGGHQIHLERVIAHRLHVNILLAAQFFFPEYLAYKKGDNAIVVFLFIVILFLHATSDSPSSSSGKCFVEHFKPGGMISVT